MIKSYGEPSATLISALRKILCPLVRLLMTHGITLPYFSNLMKEIYVEVAEREFALQDKVSTDSRISLITGVHRKDVRRLRSEQHSDMPPPAAVSMGAQVIATWISNRKYLDRKNSPKPLVLRGDGRGKQTFEQLVATVSRQDLRPRVILDELLRLGIVTVSKDEIVTLEVEAFIPASGVDEKVYYFGQNVRDHIAAAVHNLEAGKARFLERAVTYHQLSEADVIELKQIAEQSAMDSLKLINRCARQMKCSNQSKTDTNNRISFGTYFFAEEVSSRSDADDDGSQDNG